MSQVWNLKVFPGNKFYYSLGFSSHAYKVRRSEVCALQKYDFVDFIKLEKLSGKPLAYFTFKIHVNAYVQSVCLRERQRMFM